MDGAYPAPAPDAGYPGGAAAYPGATAGYPDAAAVQPAVDAPAEDGAKAVYTSLGIGLGLLVASAVVLNLSLSVGSGRVWIWGFGVGALFVARAVFLYVKAAARGAGRPGPVGSVLSLVGVVAAVVITVGSVRTMIDPMPIEVGSCFVDKGLEVEQVACSADHDYTLVRFGEVLADCPSRAGVYVELDDGRLACLADAD